MTKITKLQQVQNFINESDYESALKIVKSFPKIRGKKEQADKIKTAWDCIQNRSMYEQMGRDADQIIQDGVDMMIELYADKEENDEQDSNPIMEEKFINIDTHEEIDASDVDMSQEPTESANPAEQMHDEIQAEKDREHLEEHEAGVIISKNNPELGASTYFEKEEIDFKDNGNEIEHAIHKDIYSNQAEAVVIESLEPIAEESEPLALDMLADEEAIEAIKGYLLAEDKWSIDKTPFTELSIYKQTFTAISHDEGKFNRSPWIRKLFTIFNYNGYQIAVITQIVRSDLVTSINFVLEKDAKQIKFLQFKEIKHANLSPSSILRPKFSNRVLGNHQRYLKKISADAVNEAILRYEIRKEEIKRMQANKEIPQAQAEVVEMLKAGVKAGKLGKDLNIDAMASKISFIKM